MLFIGGVMAFDYYFAGATVPRLEQCIIEVGANVLKSFYTDKTLLNRWFEHKRNGWSGKLMIDNGEFSMHRSGGSIDIDEYIQYLNDNDDYIDYAVALDKIPGIWGSPHTREDIDRASEITYQNYLYMRERCKSPNKLLPVFHQEERMSALERLLELDGVEYICISGRKDLTRDLRKGFYARCFDVISRSKNPNIKVHCLGSGTLSDMIDFPFYSSDSTSCNMVAANGNIFVNDTTLYVGDGGKALLDDEVKIVKSICNLCGIDFESLGAYQDRAIINYKYMYAKSREVSYINRNLKLRRLFE